jgi:hypothetical protein
LNLADLYYLIRAGDNSIAALFNALADLSEDFGRLIFVVILVKKRVNKNDPGRSSFSYPKIQKTLASSGHRQNGI